MSNILTNLNDIFSKLFASVDENVFKVLDYLVFIGPNNILSSQEEKILGINSYTGTIQIALTLSIGFIIFYLLSFLISKLSFSQVQNPISFIFKMIMVSIIILNIKTIIYFFLGINLDISEQIIKAGTNISSDISFSTVMQQINQKFDINLNDTSIVSLDGIIKIYITMGMVSLLFEYALRFVLIKLLIILAPFFVLFSTSFKTKYLFDVWIKTLFALVFMQNVIAIILVLATKIDTNNIMVLSKLIYIGTIYALIKINQICKELFGGVTLQTNIPTGRMFLK